MTAKEEILARLRLALDEPTVKATPHSAGAPRPADAPVRREYFGAAHAAETDCTPEQRVEILVDRLEDYKARVHRCEEGEIASVVARVLAAAGSVVVPEGAPDAWVARLAATVHRDGSTRFTADQLDAMDAVITGSTLAIAQTGTIILDAGPTQGRRAISLVPDHHVCIVFVSDIVHTVPAGVAAIDITRPITMISGPSATSDIEFNRVEGVHGPRTLDVVIVA
ncbi:LUD domain-containing protein [Micrococcales bacterium 31B]|nr:LUD domain-containing protein [Micrococcales bacterium 31B]